MVNLIILKKKTFPQNIWKWSAWNVWANVATGQSIQPTKDQPKIQAVVAEWDDFHSADCNLQTNALGWVDENMVWVKYSRSRS